MSADACLDCGCCRRVCRFSFCGWDCPDEPYHPDAFGGHVYRIARSLVSDGLPCRLFCLGGFSQDDVRRAALALRHGRWRILVYWVCPTGSILGRAIPDADRSSRQYDRGNWLCLPGLCMASLHGFSWRWGFGFCPAYGFGFGVMRFAALLPDWVASEQRVRPGGLARLVAVLPRLFGMGSSATWSTSW